MANKNMAEQQQYLWWQEGIIYQVYPRSFQDSDNDGVGDIPGIISRLDYLQWLGINIIWLSPVYVSPMKDFGYDIADYTAIHPLFGSMADFERLVTELHTRGMRLIIDMVPNHTSDQHPWFLDARAARTNDKRDWYIWRDPVNGGVPNNWLSVFGGPAWEWDEQTQQYYYHAFLKEQPDLNYRDPRVVQALEDVMRFWLDKGVDGFRVDVMWHMIKDAQLRDNPVNPHYTDDKLPYDTLLPIFSTDQPEVHDVVKHMRTVLNQYEGRMMIGEIYLPVDKLVVYYGADNDGAHLPFNFLLLNAQWDATAIAAIIDEYEAALPKGAWPNWVLGNHDQPRIRSRVGLHQARIAAMLLLTLRGTPTIYYGDEIGMQDVAIPDAEVQDPQGLNQPGKNLSRDPARTPMQWDATSFAGFSQAVPWLRVGHTAPRENVAAESNDPDSMLMLYRRLIALRQREPALKYGSYRNIQVCKGGLAYIREAPGHDRFLVVLNLTHRPCNFQFPEVYRGFCEVATVPELEKIRVEGPLYLAGDEGMVIRLDKTENS